MFLKIQILILVVGLLFANQSIAQQNYLEINEMDASDPATMKSRFTTDIESYFFVGAAKHYSVRLGYEYGLKSQKHLVGLSIPIIHAIYVADYGGYENTTGIGDLKMRYMFVPYAKNNPSGLSRVSTYLEVTAPTGESRLGRGVGTWVYRPGLIFTFRPNPYVSFYPEVKYQFSSQSANIVSGEAPDPNDPSPDGRISNLLFSIPAVALVSDWRGWAGLNTTYIQSFSEQTYYIFLRADFGMMIGSKTSASLNITKFIAGQPRLDLLVQVKAQFFLK